MYIYVHLSFYLCHDKKCDVDLLVELCLIAGQFLQMCANLN